MDVVATLFKLNAFSRQRPIAISKVVLKELAILMLIPVLLPPVFGLMLMIRIFLLIRMTQTLSGSMATITCAGLRSVLIPATRTSSHRPAKPILMAN